MNTNAKQGLQDPLGNLLLIHYAHIPDRNNLT